MEVTRGQRRTRSQGEMLYGVHPIVQAIESGQEIERIIMRSGLRSETLPQLMQMARQRGIAVQHVPAAWFNRLGSRNHQGIVATVSPIGYQSLEALIPLLFEQGESPLIVVADGITDVRNLGAIARSAECAGAHALVVPTKGSAHINADTVKASAGALLHFPVCRTSRLDQTCQFLKECGLQLVVATEDGATFFHSADLHGPLALVLGDEGHGVSSSILRMADITVRIPIHGQVSSLNVSVAAGILLYEAERQRRNTSVQL